MSGVAQPEPWLLWGSTAAVVLNGIPLASSSQLSGQLAKVKYNRPDTWEFLLFASCDSIDSASPVVIGVDFIVTVGLGRQTVDLNPFGRIEFAVGELITGGAQRFCTSVQRPPLSATLFGAATAPNVIDHLPASDIQINAKVFSEGSINAGNIARFTVGAWLAPRSHIRPDWLKGNFTGGELNGR